MSTSEYSDSPESPRATVDEQAVQRAKREIQGIVQQISELSRRDIAPEKFYEEYLNKVVAALAASGGAVWTFSDAGVLQLCYQMNLRQTGLVENPIGQEQHGRLLTQVLTENEGKLVAPHSGAGGGSDTDDEHGAANPTDFLLVMAPVHNDQGVQGVVEVFQRPGARPATQRGYLRFLLQTCDLAGDYLRGRRLAHLAEKQSLWEQLETFTRSAHETLDVQQAAFTIANEGRRLIGCDRVTVAVKRGGRARIEAISGQDTFDRRSNIATLLTKVATAVTKTGEDVWYSGDATNLAPQVEKALEAYVDESHTKTMAILPLVEREDEDAPPEEKARRTGPPKVLGALVVEQLVDSATPEGFRQRVDVVRGHSVTAIGNALEHQSLFLMPVWKTLGKATSLFTGRRLPKTIAVLALLGGLAAAGALYQRDFKLEGEGKLRPVVQAPVFARMTGEVRQIMVDYKSPVEAGDVLMEQRSLELMKEIEDVQGKLSAAQEERRALSASSVDYGSLTPNERVQKQNELERVRKQITSLHEQLNILEEQRRQLTVRSPIDGIVTTWKLREQLMGRTVNQGQRVLQVADPSGDWEIELFMPEKRMGHVTRAWRKAKEQGEELRVAFVPATQPEDRLEGRVTEIDTTAETRGEEGNRVRMIVAFDQSEFRSVVPDPKVDAEVIAQVYCGKKPLAYTLLHDLYDTIQKEIVFPYF